jgi:ABC-2 type transport system permease protein
MGVIAKSMDALFAINKAIGILYYAPAIVWLFPGIPQWIGRIFPTYYMVGPVVEISQRGAGLGKIAGDLLVLAGLIVALIVVTGLMARRAVRREAL